MARLSTCKGCGVKIAAAEKLMKSGKAYCKKCYEISQRESEDYKALVETICNYYQISKPNPMILKDIKEYKELYGYTYSGMNYTLWYCKQIENMPFDDVKYKIGAVKFNYEKAEQYFLQQQKSAERMKHMVSVEPKVKICAYKKKESNTDKSRLLNIEQLMEGGDLK